MRVLPGKLQDRPNPPSDISGQTWVQYRDSASTFVDQEHDAKLVALVERAHRRKLPTALS
jgi:hypothetical protein